MTREKSPVTCTDVEDDPGKSPGTCTDVEDDPGKSLGTCTDVEDDPGKSPGTCTDVEDDPRKSPGTCTDVEDDPRKSPGTFDEFDFNRMPHNFMCDKDTLTKLHSIIDSLEQGLRTQNDIGSVYSEWCDLIKEPMYNSIPYTTFNKARMYIAPAESADQVVGRQMGEMYFGLAKPPAFAPDIHYKSTISKVSGSRNYTQVTIGETPGENSRCARGNQNMSPVHYDKAFFYNDDSKMTVQAIWSSDPSKYIWSMRCSNYRPGRRRCSFTESSFGLYVHGNLDDIPSTVFEDLCKATGLKFGSEKFKWTFTHGENTLC